MWHIESAKHAPALRRGDICARIRTKVAGVRIEA